VDWQGNEAGESQGDHIPIPYILKFGSDYSLLLVDLV
jgi:hypothetical protein